MLPVVACLALCLVATYFALLRKWRKNWLQQRDEASGTTHSAISTVVCVHNESGRISPLLRALANQHYPPLLWEHIWVNDYSTDRTLQLLEQQPLPCRTLILENDGNPGKKFAQKKGVEVAQNPYLAFTDADCEPTSRWLTAIGLYLEHHQPQLLMAPVKMSAGKGLWGKCMELEFMALQLCTAGSTLGHKPFLCNGANLIVEKTAYRQCDLKTNFASGDDMFLLAELKKRKATIHYLKSSDAIVTTPAPATFGQYLKQRTRWLRKGTAYRDAETLQMSLLMFSVNLMMPILFVWALLNAWVWMVFATTFGIKILADWKLLRSGKEFFNLNFNTFQVFILSMVYPFLTLLIAIFTLFQSKKRW